MKKTDFNDFAKEYDQILGKQLKFFDDSNAYFAEYKVIVSKNFFIDVPKNILDFGCGTGRSTLFLQKHFPFSHIFGCDVSEVSLIEARKKNPGVNFCMWDELNQFKVKFDFIFVACVFHHVSLKERQSLMKALVSICNENGTIIIFEHNPFNPLTRYLVNTCPFDRDAILLKPQELKLLFANAGMNKIHSQYTLFFPAFFKWMRPIERYLHAVPLGGQYLVGGINN